MARAALLESLRSQASSDVQAVHEAAQAEVRRLQAALAQELAEEERRLDESIAADVGGIEGQAQAEAALKSREAQAAATARLADHLLRLARAKLPDLVTVDPERAFAALARELPTRRWERVRVNPADAERAATEFADATVETDAAIAGGMQVECEDARIVVDNTLGTRLVTAWPDMLPAMIAEIRAIGGEHAGAA